MRASSIFPIGEPVPRDPLDFLFLRETDVLGVEMTELCREAERREGARLGYVAQKAKRLYGQWIGANAVNVSPVFSREADHMTVDELAKGLGDFVYEKRDANGNFDWHECRELPRGYSSIGVFQPTDVTPGGAWRYFRAFSVTRGTKQMIAERIAEKSQRLAEYRKIAPEVWLLIVNDLFLGPGEVSVRSEELEEWAFDFAFDKVFLFERQPGGSGAVIELRRH